MILYLDLIIKKNEIYQKLEVIIIYNYIFIK